MTDIQKLKALAEHHRSLGHAYTVATPAAVLDLIESEEEATALCDKLSGLLCEVALAVRGPYEPLRRHGFADLPSRVKAVVSEHDQLKTESADLHATLQAAKGEIERLNAGALEDLRLRTELMEQFNQLKAENEALRKALHASAVAMWNSEADMDAEAHQIDAVLASLSKESSHG